MLELNNSKLVPIKGNPNDRYKYYGVDIIYFNNKEVGKRFSFHGTSDQLIENNYITETIHDQYVIFDSRNKKYV